ncbi:MAG: NAD(P)H-dependent oxidoreductase subunit E, partial [Casimicrobiaceae bacterium]
ALRRDRLIEYLHVLNDAEGAPRRGQLAALARRLGLSVADVHEAASFYEAFRILDDEVSPPRVNVRVCTTLSCKLAGAGALLEAIRASAPKDVQVIPAACLGRCDRAPAVLVGRQAISNATADTVQAAVRLGARTPPALSAPRLAQALAAGGYSQWQRCRNGALSREAVMSEIASAGLRGLGGAGFPAARKWSVVRAGAAPRYLVVNFDESEPGTFKDRHLVTTDPHRFLEGVLIAAWVIEAAGLFIYIRDEYAAEHALLAQLAGELSGPAGWPELPPIEIRRGAGAYVCGEESALVESLEGKRGWPRLRPPYLAERGLFGRPTLEHNVETLCWLPVILARGAAWWRSQGRRGSSGLRAFSISGRVRQPGVAIAPAGSSARELIEAFAGGMAEGHRLYAYLPGGASGGILPAALADLPLDFGTLEPHGAAIGSAALIVLSEADRAAEAARNLADFFAHESCGQCTPCRVGTQQLRRLTAGSAWAEGELAPLMQVMRDASICGLG